VRAPKTDARGTAAVDVSGNVQVQILVLANATIAVWLFAIILGLA
jgi:hypothetical protein